jgi:hemerythrin
MSLIKWSDNLSVQVEQMDQQHQQLFALINDLNDAMSKGKGKEVIGKIMDSILNDARIHFTDEENLLKQFNYPDAVHQKRMHDDFIKKADDIKKQLDSGKIDLSIEIVNFLSDWLKDHIQTEDKKYALFLDAVK